MKTAKKLRKAMQRPNRKKAQGFYQTHPVSGKRSVEWLKINPDWIGSERHMRQNQNVHS